MAIRVTELSKSYGNQQALKGISFEARAGRVLGFLGPNGAGKSTTMKILCGSLLPTAGEAWVAGLHVHRDSLEVRRKIGYLPETNPLYPDMYIRETLNFMASLHRLSQPRKRIEEVITLTGLAPELHKKIRQLSKGYRQRVGLAQAILHDPDVLILDEPTSGLDPNQLRDIRTLIRQLGSEKTVLLSTHIMQEVEALCDDVVIIRQGEIVADFELADLNRKYPDTNLEKLFIRLTAGE
ncbi:ATP-binding cassette domain-containing protein [Parapedobacter lycopersici]|uniref:ATP-binding cassette domain-containing protein n=1 Tax=Parapedobacter lycopersici TaxID=1864939 RepID=UPI00333E30A3